MNTRQLFLQHTAQTSPAPLALEIKSASGVYLTDVNDKTYIDLIAGISVSNIGHKNKRVIDAIKKQAEDYLHLMVYGEFINQPNVAFASLLAQHLPNSLNCVYFTTGGSEATEGAIKLAKRYTGKPEIVCFNNSYHGSTNGALSLIGSEYWRNAFRPLLPGIKHAEYNNPNAINTINNNTACVVVEFVQAESGVTTPNNEWLKALKQKCETVGALLIADEIQTGFGRTGSLFAFEETGVVPDILLLGKALGGGMPLGAFISSHALMQSLTHNPVLGHINTFGGHPVCCAAGMEAFKVLLDEELMMGVNEKGLLFEQLLQHKKIKSFRRKGLLIALEFEDFNMNKNIIDACIENGVITDWFLFAANCLRIAPPLIITKEEITKACEIILKVLE
jgi:acetylornithine/N-succinyldiaminopimelate aminotransferase